MKVKTQLEQEGAPNPQETFLELQAFIIRKIGQLSPTKHISIITSLGVIADLPNTQRQNEETKEYGTNEKKSPEKKLNEMEATKTPNA